MNDYQFEASGKKNYAEFVSPAYYQPGSNGFGSNVKGVFD
jgi:hypothetical protein